MDNKQFKVSANDIQLIVYDFDGVMTDNRAIIFQDGTEAVVVNRADGLGVGRLRAMKIPQLILSTETNLVVKARATKLGLEAITSCENKEVALKKYCQQNNYELKKVVFVGNDLNDLEVMKIVGFPIAPADAYPKIKDVAKYITKAKGGEGVIREMSDIIIL